MAGYFDEKFKDSAVFYEFFYDIWNSIFLVIFLAYFIIRIVRNLRQIYIDILKIFQLSLVIVIWIRFITLVMVKVTTQKEDTELFLIIFTNVLNSRMLYWLLCQFSWYILYTHLNAYKMMIIGRPYSDCKYTIKQTERRGIVVIIAINIVFNLVLLLIDLINFYYPSYQINWL